MIHLLIDEDTRRKLPFYLAMEEWAATNLEADEYLFIWQVNPTVIIGRNQSIDTEVNLEYCREHGIEVYRRKSGGGCVYADSHNLMFSYITPSTEVVTTFASYTARIAEMLRGIGIDAKAGGRNDITIEGRKVSGNAFYHLHNRSIAHGTMLYDTDRIHMANAITPSRSKLESKLVKSVESRITTLSEHTTMNLEDFKHYAIDSLCDREIKLSASDIKEIERIAEPYFNKDNIYGRRRSADIKHRRRIEGVGEFEVGIRLSNGHIRDIDIEGDFFPMTDIDKLLLEPLTGVKYNKEDIERAIKGINVSQIIAGLDNKQFTELITT